MNEIPQETQRRPTQLAGIPWKDVRLMMVTQLKEIHGTRFRASVDPWASQHFL